MVKGSLALGSTTRFGEHPVLASSLLFALSDALVMLTGILVWHEHRLVGRRKSVFPMPISRQCVSERKKRCHVPKIVHPDVILHLNSTAVINPENASELLVIDEAQDRILTVNMDMWFVPLYHSLA